jgi:hypothetical protein
MQPPSSATADANQWVDADGFTHIAPAANAPEREPERWVGEIARFLDGLRQAAQRDVILPA